MKGDSMNIVNRKVFIVLTMAIGMLFTSTAIAQHRDHRERGVRTRHPVYVKHLPSRHTTIHHGGRSYYSYNGIYYHRRSGGYVIVRPPVGLRVHRLPIGYISLQFGAAPYYYYYGTYYHWDPVQHVYIVVEKPSGTSSVEQQSAEYDQIVLVDGSTLEGVYLKGDEKEVQFEVDGKVRDIPVDKIVSIQFAPSNTPDDGAPNDQ